MTVNITKNDYGLYSADKTFDEIVEFYNNGGIVEVLFENNILPLVHIDSNGVVFSLLALGGEMYIPEILFAIASNNEVMFQEVGHATLPPISDGDQDKFLKGDGTWSKIQTVTDEHINNLINEALGVIENGTY